MARFNVGDKVRIRSTRGNGWNTAGKMDKWCGKVMTIRKNCSDWYFMEEDKLENGGTGWCWSDDDIVEKITTPKYKVGDKVRVRKDLVIGKQYGGVTLLDGMAKYCGETLTIRSIIDDDYECSNGFYYNELMLEPACKFKVGDKVIGNAKASENYGITNEGYEGVVTEVFENGFIKLDDIFRVKSDCFDLITEDQPTKIVITTDGRTTTAEMYRGETVVKKSEAYCHPSDTFDFNVGARLAFDRLVGEDEKKEEAPKGTLKIKIGKKYKLKDYDKVTSPNGISRETWEKIQKAGAVTIERKAGDTDYYCETCYKGGWYINRDAFECEWEEPISVDGFKVGDRVNYNGHNGTVICFKKDNGCDVGVEFDDYKPYDHNCDTGVELIAGQYGKSKRCAWLFAKEIEHGEVPTYYNGKVICVDDNDYYFYTKGKIYQFKDGIAFDDFGGRFNTKPFTSFDELAKWSHAKWLEVVE